MIDQWQNFEMRSLREECHKRNKDFYVISDSGSASGKFLEFLEYLKSGTGSFALALELVRQIKQLFPEPCELYVIDGDKTIIRQDSFRFCCEGKTDVFDGNFYTGYQSFLFAQESLHVWDSVGKIFAADKVKQIEYNDSLIKKIRDSNYIILSSGMPELWDRSRCRKSTAAARGRSRDRPFASFSACARSSGKLPGKILRLRARDATFLDRQGHIGDRNVGRFGGRVKIFLLRHKKHRFFWLETEILM